MVGPSPLAYGSFFFSLWIAVGRVSGSVGNNTVVYFLVSVAIGHRPRHSIELNKTKLSGMSLCTAAYPRPSSWLVGLGRQRTRWDGIRADLQRAMRRSARAWQNRDNRFQRVLVVRQRWATVAPPPARHRHPRKNTYFCSTGGGGAVGRECRAASGRYAGGRKHPQAPTSRLLFQDELATPAALAFLRETRIKGMVTLAPLERERGGLEEIVLRPEQE